MGILGAVSDATLLNIATLTLAGATFALVLVTGWSTRKLVHEGREGRREDRAEKRRTLVRAAVAEGVDNARAWWAVEPRRLTLGEKQRIVPEFQFKAFGALVDNLDLPPDVVAYLLCARGYVGDLRDRYASCVADKEGAQPVNECRDLWASTLDLLQTIPVLIRAHGMGEPELAPAMSGFNLERWLVAQERPPQTRELEHIQRMAMDGAPPWPIGEFYASSSPAARYAEGARTGDRSREQLATPLATSSTHRSSV